MFFLKSQLIPLARSVGPVRAYFMASSLEITPTFFVLSNQIRLEERRISHYVILFFIFLINFFVSLKNAAVASLITTPTRAKLFKKIKKKITEWEIFLSSNRI